MLISCIDRCPEKAWNSPVRETLFCQVAFHTLFYAHFNLGSNEESFRQQPFHLNNREFFRDYEELEDHTPELLYDRLSIKRYLEHCREKAAHVTAPETAERLSTRAGFQRREFSRAALHVFTIRHIQNHAAQLALRLTTNHNEDIPWVGSGWREV
jgi:hypothetical protein